MIDETYSYEEEMANRARLRRIMRFRGMRRWMIGMPLVGGNGQELIKKKLNNLWIPICYGIKHAGRSRRIPVNVDEEVEKWLTSIRGLSMAHTREEVQKHDYGLDEILKPMLKAPVKQLRELYEKLLARMKDDPQVPFFIWSSLEAFGQQFLIDAPDDAGIKLKTRLARKIAEMVEADVEPQLVPAIANALKWRNPEDLDEIKEVIKEENKKPAKTRQKAQLVGRQSCLFLKVGKKEVML